MNGNHRLVNGMRIAGLRIALGTGILAAMAGIYAFRTLSARPGEGALRFIPADAELVGTLDLSPSASQTLAFKHLADGLSRNNMGGQVETSLLDLIDRGSEGGTALHPLIEMNGLIAELPDPTDKYDTVIQIEALPVTDGQAAQQILAKYGHAQFYKGLKYYKFKDEKEGLMVIDDTIFASFDPRALYQIKLVRDGVKPSISTDPKFIGARSHVADDANLMVFVSPRFIKATKTKMADGILGDWLSVGLAIRDGGIGVSCSGLMDLKSNAEVAKLGSVAAVRPDLFKVLPSGMYGSIVVSQPSGHFEAMEPTLKKDENTRKGFDKFESGMEKDAGISLRKDLLPAFEGDTIVAAYPASTGSLAGAELLVEVDDLHGADPANAVERFQDWIQKQADKEGKKAEPMWTVRSEGNDKYYSITDKMRGELRDSMKKGMDPKSVNTAELSDNKTFVWATIGKGVFAATSQELLDRAISSSRTKTGGLDTDSKFAPAESDVLDGSQEVTMFSLSRIAEGIKNTVKTDKMDKDSRQMFDTVIDAFTSLDQPLTIHGKMQSDGRMSGGAFIPLDYDKMLDLAGKLQKKSK